MRDGLQAGDIDGHMQAEVLPDDNDQNRPKNRCGISHKGWGLNSWKQECIYGSDKAVLRVIDELPEYTCNNFGQHVRQKEKGPEENRTFKFPVAYDECKYHC